MPLDPESLDSDPLHELAAWLEAARDAGHPLPEAFALATTSQDGEPSVRMVLLRGIGPDGLRIYTNRESRKGRDLAQNPRAAGTFWWPQTDRQVRVAGPVRRLDVAESAEYWASRPRGSRLSAWASEQGREIAARAALVARVGEIASRFPEEVPLPPFWGGYALVPEVMEFWESRPDRLHDRIEYRRRTDGGWDRRRLQP